jgi:predicted metal-dependent hydrolase
LLHIEEVNAAPKIEVHPRHLILFLRPGSTLEKRQSILAAWYRKELRQEAADLIDHWQQRLDVQINKLFVQAMSRQWGSCNPSTKNIRLNTQLAQKPRACLDYIVLHELAHLRVPTHGEEFVALLNSLQPDWEERRRLLNSFPLIEGKCM